MGAAARNLVPVTLELSGKLPVVISRSADLTQAVQRIMVGKMLNAGKVCIAPDYVLVPPEQIRAPHCRTKRFPQTLVHLFSPGNFLLKMHVESSQASGLVRAGIMTCDDSYIDITQGKKIMAIIPALVIK
jgi:hypothetical protein